MSMSKRLGLSLIEIILFIAYISPASAMERRREQFVKEPAHYIVPAPISYPGIGEGIAVIGISANEFDSYTDYGLFAMGGDFTGIGGVITDLHLIDRTLIAEVAAQKLNKVAVLSYNNRGMNNSEDDYSVAELDNVESTIARLRGTFHNRMFEVQAMLVNQTVHVAALRDKDGNLIQDTSASNDESAQFMMLDFLFDWTDDYQDPRKGLRYSISRWWGDDATEGAPEYYQQEHNLTAYVPVGKISTWVFNLFKSDAFVTRQGDTNFSSVESRAGLNCSALSGTQQTRCIDYINNAISHNRYGTAASMGGPSRLRSYPEGRYKGAHVLFYGTEYRWNLTEELKPFDIGIARDIRTGVQLSAFWERATVSDERGQLGDIWRDSFGVGMRLVMTSGIVFRAEYAYGDEGGNVVMFFNYPWSGY